jgi:transcriptional regulator with XRE-family HTH domain
MSDRTPSAVDKHVASVIAGRRRALGMSQAQLAEAIGVIANQVHKYEIGQDRLSVGRLWAMSQALDVTPQFFFDGLSICD